MSGLENLKVRLDYRGGEEQQKRMIERKLETLKRALLYSYQAATITTQGNLVFRCLINGDKLRNDLDEKIISIPFEDTEIKSKEKKQTQLTAGQVVLWNETQTHWLVYKQRLEEKAYFRAELRKCEHILDIDENHRYHVYAKQKHLGEIPWITAKGGSYNELDYLLELFIPKDEVTEHYFTRFKQIKFLNHNWEVQACDSVSTNGIVQVLLKEFFENDIKDKIDEENAQKQEKPIKNNIIGPNEVYPYDELNYEIQNVSEGYWSVDSSKAKIISDTTKEKIKIMITTGRSGKFNLIYTQNIDNKKIIFPITIKSL